VTGVLHRLRPHPHRGDVIAAGAVPLSLATILIDLRMTQWSPGSRFVVVGAISSLILAMGWLAELERETPRAYHSTLLVAGLLPLVLALALLAEMLGAHRPPGPGADFWTFAAEAVIAAAAARRANSGACTLIAALAAAVALQSFVGWVFHPHGLGTFRALLLVLTLAFAAGAVRLRDARRRHAVQLVNAAGLMALVLALLYVAETVIVAAVTRGGIGASLPISGLAGTRAPLGWKLYVIAVGLGLVAYAGADREPGPAYVGVAVLAAFAVLAGLPLGGRGTLVGWPLLLLVLGTGGLAIGLRPRRPLPPEPPGPASAEAGAPAVPLRGGAPVAPLRGPGDDRP